MTDQEFWTEVRRKEAELKARYEAINQTWRDSGIPGFVWKTPDWQGGWAAYLDWKNGLTTALEIKFRPSDFATWPHSSAHWATEVHITSHQHCPGGHCPEHAALEEEGMRAILAWWNERAGTEGRPA